MSIECRALLEHEVEDHKWHWKNAGSSVGCKSLWGDALRIDADGKFTP